MKLEDLASEVEKLEKKDKVGAFAEKALSTSIGVLAGIFTFALTGEPVTTSLVAAGTSSFVHHELEQTSKRNQIREVVYSKQ